MVTSRADLRKEFTSVRNSTGELHGDNPELIKKYATWLEEKYMELEQLYNELTEIL